MPSLIEALRRVPAEASFTYRSDFIEHVDELRIRAAGALINISTVLEAVGRLLRSGRRMNDEMIRHLLESARTSIREGGDICAVLDLDRDSLRPGSFIWRLACFYGASAAYDPGLKGCQAAERLAAATRLSEIDRALRLLVDEGGRYPRQRVIEAIDRLSARCWEKPDRLPGVPSLAAAA